MTRHRWVLSGAGVLAAAVLAGCAGGSARPKPAELPPNVAVVGVRQAWTARLPAVAFPLQVNVQGQQVALAATDPANPYGVALPWPDDTELTHRPGRKAGALVVLVDGALVWFVERGGRTLLSFTDDPGSQQAAAAALSGLVSTGRVPSLLVEKINGTSVLELAGDATLTAVQDALLESGFARTPRGLRLR